MEVRQAVAVAKQYVMELFGEEGISEIGLEEIEVNEDGHWNITIGFARPWDRKLGSVLAGANARSYKILIVRDKDRKVLSVRNRSFSEG